MLDQVAALQELLGTVERGYRLATEGVEIVREIRNGVFDLHDVFFGSLLRVDDGVRGSPLLAEAWRYAELNGDQEALEMLRLLTRDDVLTMTDGERLGMIMRIRDEMRGRYGSIRKRDAAGSWIDGVRKKEETNLETLKELYWY